MEKLTEMMQFRNELTKRYNNLEDAKKVYNFIIGDNLPAVPVAAPTTEPIVDGVYYILENGHYFPANEVSCKIEDIVAVGVKLGNRHAAIALKDLQGGDSDHEYPLCNDNYKNKKSGNTYYDKEYQAISDMNGRKNTDTLISSGLLNEEIIDDMKEGQYIPSCGELHLLVLFLDEVNSALEAVGGQKLAGGHWSSSEYSLNNSWNVNFSDGGTIIINKYYGYVVRPAVAWTL